MKYVQINTVPHGSTGSVMFQTQSMRIASGDECWTLWGRGRAAQNVHELNFGSKIGTCVDAVLTRFDDRAGFHSKVATGRLISMLDEIDPDIVHLHNMHGYYLNVGMLFDWLANHRCQVLWTLHDCWAFTGHCVYFTVAGCEAWKTGCPGMSGKCPQKTEYPKSSIVDSSAANYRDKKRIFTKLPKARMTIIAPSHWMANLVEQSFLGKYPIVVHHNEIDESVFEPTPSDFRNRYGIGERFIVLGVANPWTERKGLDVFLRLADDLDESFVVVLVGLNNKKIRQLGNKVVALPRIESKKHLAEVYTAADVFVNPSIEETFGLTVAEAQACGTPSIVMRGSACVEAAREDYLYIVEGSYESLKAQIETLRRHR